MPVFLSVSFLFSLGPGVFPVLESVEAAGAVSVEIEDILNGDDAAAVLGLVAFLEVGERLVQEFLLQSLGHGHEGIPGGLIRGAEPAHGTGDFFLAGQITAVDEFLDGRLHVQSADPV